MHSNWSLLTSTLHMNAHQDEPSYDFFASISLSLTRSSLRSVSFYLDCFLCPFLYVFQFRFIFLCLTLYLTNCTLFLVWAIEFRLSFYLFNVFFAIFLDILCCSSVVFLLRDCLLPPLLSLSFVFVFLPLFFCRLICVIFYLPSVFFFLSVVGVFLCLTN